MSETRRPLETSPRGIAKWTTLNTPDTKFKACGEYRVVLLLKGAAAEKLQARIDEALAQAVVEAKANKDNAKHAKNIKIVNRPYKPDTDKEGNETGFTAFTFSCKASGLKKDKVTPWTFQPRVFDHQALPIDLKKVQIWGGSEVKVSYEFQMYGVHKYSPTVGAGVTLKMGAVQVIVLKTGSGKDGAAFGFTAEEGTDEVADEATTAGDPTDTNEDF